MTSPSWSFAAIVRRGWQVFWVRGLGRLLGLLLVAPIRVYQWTLSPLLGPTCKYHPSCSRYAVGALQVHGPGKGLLLGGWRLLRCNPWSQGGLDPVPERGRWRPPIHTDGSPRTGGADVSLDDAPPATPDRGATMHAVVPTPTSPGA